MRRSRIVDVIIFIPIDEQARQVVFAEIVVSRLLDFASTSMKLIDLLMIVICNSTNTNGKF